MITKTQECAAERKGSYIYFVDYELVATFVETGIAGALDEDRRTR